jgi:hypothetical protein
MPPGNDDPTEHAERLRECMAEVFRIGQETDNDTVDALTTSAHESIRIALQAERQANGVEGNYFDD